MLPVFQTLDTDVKPCPSLNPLSLQKKKKKASLWICLLSVRFTCTERTTRSAHCVMKNNTMYQVDGN